MDLGQYDSLGEYCDPHTASSVFLILTLDQNGKCYLVNSSEAYLQEKEIKAGLGEIYFI